MYNLYYVDNTKKSYIRGLWSDKGKVYFDNIHIKAYRNKTFLKGDIDKLFCNNEKAVFYNYINNDNFYNYDFIGIIEYDNGDKKILNNRLMIRRNKLSVKELKSLLKKYNGLTIYNHKSYFYIELYY